MTGKGRHSDSALRRWAENLAGEKAVLSPVKIAALSPEEILRLLQELRVHQIELRMQNDELRRTEEELADAQKRYFDLYDLAPVGYCILSEQGLILEANLTAAGMLNVARSAMVKQPITRFILKEDGDIYYLHRKRLSESGEPQTSELRMTRTEGPPFWARLDATAAQGVDGAPICRVVMSDLTNAKQAEWALQESEARFRDLYNLAPVAFVSVDVDNGTLTRFNEMLPRLLGADPETLRRTKGLALYADTPDGMPKAKGLFERIAAGETVHDVELQMKRAGGGVIWVSFSANPVFDAGGRVTRSRSAIVDITERKALEEQLRQALKMEAVGQLTGGLAHDLNNSLAVISINVDLLNLVAADNPKATRHIEAALNGVRRAAALTRKLLDFSRIEAGETHRVQINEFVTGMENLIARSLTPAIALQIVQSEKPWSVDISPADFEAALLNLALNARDAMPNGGTLVIETANRVLDEFYVAHNPGSSVGEFVMVSVSDTGTGMTPDVVAKAFEPFFTTKDVGEGTGLGLSTVHAFVRRSGGHVTIYSEPGEGTTVRLYLPRTGGEAKDAKGRPTAGTNLPRGDETILVVDDEDPLVETAVIVLTALGYRTRTAADGQRALDILKDDPSIDLLFSDVIMPNGIDGYRLAMEALKARPELKVLLTSGFTRKRHEFVNEDRTIAADLARDLLPKPFNIAELANAVRRALDGATETSD